MTVWPSGGGSEGRGLKYSTSTALGTTTDRIEGTNARARASSATEQKATPSNLFQISISSRRSLRQEIEL